MLAGNLKTILKLPLSILFIAVVLSCAPTDREPEIVKKTDSDLVLIPGGECIMGKNGEGDHSPAHKMYIDSFLIDAHEVTNSQYFAFCQKTDRRLPEFWGMDGFHCGPGFPNHPVVGVSWSDAKEYAVWAGKRLPTEAEWEYAARGGLIGKNYPTGDDLDSTQANYTIQGKGKGTVPVGSYPPNGYGLYDMAGNVVEWVSDYYAEDYYSICPYENPIGPEKGKFRVIRGGGWHSGPSCNSVFFRNALPGGWVDFNVGFRCAKDVP
jgi:formylglycine-generating enzyme required for sulfatase activity